MFHNILNKLPKSTTIHGERYDGIILEGRPGIGKTAMAMSLIKGVKSEHIVRVPMATRTYEEFGALPYPMQKKQQVIEIDDFGNVVKENGEPKLVEQEGVVVEQALSEVSVVPLLEENIGEQYGVLILDDVTLGDPRLQSALLELVQFGVIANKRLGKNVIIFLTGNKTEDGAYAIEWSTALLGRCIRIEVEPNFDIWLALEENSNLCPTVVGFLKEYPQFFAPVVGDEKTTDENNKTPAPRDWTRLGKAMTQVGGYAQFEPDFMFTSSLMYSNSMVGKKAGVAYNQYAKAFGVYPSAERLWKNPKLWADVPLDKRDMVSGCLAVVFALKNHAIKKALSCTDNQKEVLKVLTQLFDLTSMISNNNRELISFMLSSLIAWSKEHKEQKNVDVILTACANVLLLDKYAKDKTFTKFLNAIRKHQ